MKPTATAEKKVVQVGGEKDKTRPLVHIINITDDAPQKPAAADLSPVYSPSTGLAPPEITRPWTCHYVMSILTTIACFGPLSVIGLVHFLTARSERNNGKYEQALKHKKTAKACTVLACLIGLIVTLCTVAFFMCLAYRMGYIKVNVKSVGTTPYPSDPSQVRFLPSQQYPSNPEQVVFHDVTTKKYPSDPNQVNFLEATSKKYPSDPNQVHFLSGDDTESYPSDPNQVHFLPTRGYPSDPDQVKFLESTSKKYPSNPDQVHFMPEIVHFINVGRQLIPKYTAEEK